MPAFRYLPLTIRPEADRMEFDWCAGTKCDIERNLERVGSAIRFKETLTAAEVV